MPTGPSAALVLQLHCPPPTAEGRPAPPLQRPSKNFYAVAIPNSGEECLMSHVNQIEERQAMRVAMRKEAKARHIAEMTELRDRVGAGFEEQAARRAWHKTIAVEQQTQTAEKQTTALLDYKESHTGIEYWPYEADPPAFVLPEPKVYGAELLAAAADKDRQKALQKALRRGGSTSLRLRKEREKEQRAHDASQRLAPAEVRAALNAAAARKRATVSEQAEARASEQRTAEGGGSTLGGSASGARETFFSGEDVVRQMGRMQLKEAQRDLRAHQNKLQLREVLAKQAAEKRLRELREHQSMYGELPESTATLTKLTNRASVGPSDAETKWLAGAARRQELEDAIADKQRERHELRRAQKEEQRRLDEAAATEEVLVYERDRYVKKEQQTAMALALTKQEADAKRRSKKVEPL